MGKRYFFVRLLGPRPTFPHDMNDAERALMREHALYTQRHFLAGEIVIYGPVIQELDSFGMAVFGVASEVEVRAVMDADPSVVAGMNRYELAPMHVAAARGL